MKKTPLKRTPFKRKPYGVSSKVLVRSKIKIPKFPVWIKAIPENPAHGSGTLQKRLWRLVSDYVRIRDWYEYKGLCVATGAYIPSWIMGNAGHFKPYSTCNGMFKFDERNIHLQSVRSNKWGNMEDWYRFEEELLRRSGLNRAGINALNLEYETRLTDAIVIAKMEDILHKMSFLKEQPAYYARVKALKSATV